MVDYLFLIWTLFSLLLEYDFCSCSLFYMGRRACMADSTSYYPGIIYHYWSLFNPKLEVEYHGSKCRVLKETTWCWYQLRFGRLCTSYLILEPWFLNSILQIIPILLSYGLTVMVYHKSYKVFNLVEYLQGKWWIKETFSLPFPLTSRTHFHLSRTMHPTTILSFLRLTSQDELFS